MKVPDGWWEEPEYGGYWVRCIEHLEPEYDFGNHEVRIMEDFDGEGYHHWYCVPCSFKDSEPFFAKPAWQRWIINQWNGFYYSYVLMHRWRKPKYYDRGHEGVVATIEEAFEAADRHVREVHGGWGDMPYVSVEDRTIKEVVGNDS